MTSAVAAHGYKAAVPVSISLSRNLYGVTGLAGLYGFDLYACAAQPFEDWPHHLAAATVARRRVYYSEVGGLRHSSTTAVWRSSLLRISSASAMRLILSEAVRGKSLSQKT